MKPFESKDLTIYPIRSEGWKKLREWGVVLEDIIEEQIIDGCPVTLINDSCVRAILPSGWNRITDGHSDQTYLVDDRGLIRATIYTSVLGDCMVVAEKRYTARSYCEDPNAAYQYHVFDEAINDKIVKSYPPVYWGHATNDRFVAGIIKGRLFYSNPFKGIDRVIRFRKIRPSSQSTPITYEDFIDNYHGDLLKRGAFMEIEAGDNLAKRRAVALVEKLNSEANW